MEATFTYFFIGSVFFNIFFIRLVKTNFLSWKQCFLIRGIFQLLELLGKQFSKKEFILTSGQLIFWLVEIIFFSIFLRLLPVIIFFASSGNNVSRKSFIPASGILFSLNQNSDSRRKWFPIVGQRWLYKKWPSPYFEQWFPLAWNLLWIKEH